MKKMILGLLVSAIVCGGSLVHAGPIEVDSGWIGFCFGVSGSPAVAGCQNQASIASGNPFTFTALTPVLFKITDAFNRGDTFDVFELGLKILDTPVVVSSSASMTGNPDIAFSDPTYSHASIPLSAGAHEINVFADVSLFGQGGAYLEIETLATTAVSEPWSLALITAALVGAGLARRGKNRRLGVYCPS